MVTLLCCPVMKCRFVSFLCCRTPLAHVQWSATIVTPTLIVGVRNKNKCCLDVLDSILYIPDRGTITIPEKIS